MLLFGFRCVVIVLSAVGFFVHTFAMPLFAEGSDNEQCRASLEQSAMPEATETFAPLCGILANDVCEWFAVHYSGTKASCQKGVVAVGSKWHFSVKQIAVYDHIEFDLLIVGPSQELSGYRERGFERHRLRFYIVFGLSGQLMGIPFLHDPRYNRGNNIKWALEQGNPNNLVLSDGDALEVLYSDVQKVMASGIDAFWRDQL